MPTQHGTSVILEELLEALKSDDRCQVRQLCALIDPSGKVLAKVVPPKLGSETREFTDMPILVMRAILRVLLEMDWHTQVQELLNQGLDPHLAITSAGDNLLHYACSFGASCCVQVILKHALANQKPQVQTDAASQSTNKHLSEIALVNSLDDAGRTPLVSWVRHNPHLRRTTEAAAHVPDGGAEESWLLGEASTHVCGGELLLHFGAKCTAVDHRGRTVLLHACDGGVATSSTVLSLLQCAESEIQSGHAPRGFNTLREYVQFVSNAGDTALYRAAQGSGRDNELTVDILLRSGALEKQTATRSSSGNPKGRDLVQGSDPLIAAIFRSRLNVVHALIRADAKIPCDDMKPAADLVGFSALTAPCGICDSNSCGIHRTTVQSSRLMQQIQQETGNSPLAWALSVIKRNGTQQDSKWLESWWLWRQIRANNANVLSGAVDIWCCLSHGTSADAADPAAPRAAASSPAQRQNSVVESGIPYQTADTASQGSEDGGSMDGSAFAMLDGSAAQGDWDTDTSSTGSSDEGHPFTDAFDDDRQAARIAGIMQGLALPPASVCMLTVLGMEWAKDWLLRSRHVPVHNDSTSAGKCFAQPPQAWGGCRGRSLSHLICVNCMSNNPVALSATSKLVFGEAFAASFSHGAACILPVAPHLPLYQNAPSVSTALSLIDSALSSRSGHGSLTAMALSHAEDAPAKALKCLQQDGLRAAAGASRTDVLARALLHAQVSWHRRRVLLLCRRS